MNTKSANNRDWPSDTAALLKLGKLQVPNNYWTVNDAFQGTQVFGATGSGKSSGSGRAIAEAFMRSNFGGLVLTAKNDERATWESLAEKFNRTQDLVIFGEEQSHRFNFLRYERARSGKGSGHTENLVNLFCAVMEVADRKSSSDADAYWMRAMKQLLRNSFDLMLLAGVEVSLHSLYELITSAPATLAESKDPEWQYGSACYRLILHAKSLVEDPRRQSDLKATEAYWLRDFANLASETKTCIVNMFTSMADTFLRGMMAEMFCSDLNFTPEDCFAGKVIVLDFPVKAYQGLGIFAQVLFKYVWQRAVEARVPALLPRTEIQETIRPVFLWADESQFFVNGYDSLFQSTARSSRACTVYLTQNLPGYQDAFGAASGKAAAESFLGNLQTKIFHANGDPQTNNWAADSIGRVKQVQIQSGWNQSEQNKGSNQSTGSSLAFEYSVQPQVFTLLKSGGVENQGAIESIIFQAGRPWAVEAESGQKVLRNHLRHTFKQF